MNNIKEVKSSSEELLNFITKDYTLDVSYDKENDCYSVLLNSEKEAGLLIGSRGKGLEALQVIISLIVRNKVGEWLNINVDLAGWKQREEERLKDLAGETAKRAILTGEAQALYNLTASQRRIVHLALSEREDVKTESYGEGKDRYLTVLPNK